MILSANTELMKVHVCDLTRGDSIYSSILGTLVPLALHACTLFSPCPGYISVDIIPNSSALLEWSA